MGRKKKPFIDKKNATTYRLVHRSQQDPLIADDTANQMVLDEVQSATDTKQERLKTQKEFGIYYEDDYDYMQHMKEAQEEGMSWEAVNPTEGTEASKVELPTSAFASAEEQPIGMLNLAAPRGLDLSLDPDIVAALDDDFDFEDPNLELEDDFMDLAEGVEEGGMLEDISEEDYGNENDDVDSMFSNEAEEEGCRFTEYSVSSSVLPRNEGLALLDDKFEEMFKEYDEMGAGEEELKPVDELEGGEPNFILEQLCNEFERQDFNDEETVGIVKTRTLELAALQEENTEKKVGVVKEAEEKAEVQWDCETILSTYTNIYNHPKLISIPPKVRLNKKGVVVEEKSGIEEDEDEDEGVSVSDEDEDTIVISNLRTKSETLEEKKARKKAVKESQKLRRQIKKATKEVFRDENCLEQRVNANKAGRTIKL